MECILKRSIQKDCWWGDIGKSCSNQKGGKALYIRGCLPKATVQAAIGSIPLSIGLPCGNIILSVAVLGILITAPLGAILMDYTKDTLLQKNLAKLI